MPDSLPDLHRNNKGRSLPLLSDFLQTGTRDKSPGPVTPRHTGRDAIPGSDLRYPPLLILSPLLLKHCLPLNFSVPEDRGSGLLPGSDCRKSDLYPEGFPPRLPPADPSFLLKYRYRKKPGWLRCQKEVLYKLPDFTPD